MWKRKGQKQTNSNREEESWRRRTKQGSEKGESLVNVYGSYRLPEVFHVILAAGEINFRVRARTVAVIRF